MATVTTYKAAVSALNLHHIMNSSPNSLEAKVFVKFFLFSKMKSMLGLLRSNSEFILKQRQSFDMVIRVSFGDP